MYYRFAIIKSLTSVFQENEFELLIANLTLSILQRLNSEDGITYGGGVCHDVTPRNPRGPIFTYLSL